MLLITTPTGNTERHVLQAILAQGEPVRVLVRDPARLDASVQSRCQVVQADLRDPADLAQALDGIEGVFFCVPQSPDPDDISAYYHSFADPFAKAATTAGIQRVVAVSGGDGNGSGNRGVGLALHQLEQTISATGIAARYVRCGYFMENFFWQIQSIARESLFSLPIAGDVPIPFVAARDIGAAAAHLLLDRSWSDQVGVAAHGSELLSCDTAAKIASEVLGFAVHYQPISGADYKTSLSAHGCSDALGQSLVEMFDAIAAGQDMAVPVARSMHCPTTLRNWMESVLKMPVTQIRSSMAAQRA
jgi:uncharacterized protein YbjT (DUF2867 family)